MLFDAYTMHKLRSNLNELDAWLDAEYDFTHRMRESPDSARISEDECGRFVSYWPKFPDILLLTVVRESASKKHYQLTVDVSYLSLVHSWLRPDDKPSLDGVHLQYQPEMLQPDGIAAMQALSKEYLVGVWAHDGDPDDIVTATCLVRECEVSFVNTDF